VSSTSPNSPLVDDQDAVERFAADGADEAFGDGVRPRCPARGSATASPPSVLGSDGEGEVGERVCEPMSGIDLGSEFVVAAAQVLDEAVLCAAAGDPSVGSRRG
jgi:hypothetical protein